ncbi:MAG: TonB-dependent receptor [Cytophagales bacterium]|nr:TonB-dependent receptor [Cytophagales bacterium]
MKRKWLLTVYKIMKLSFYGCFLQIIILNTLLANIATGQNYKNVKEVHIDLRLTNVPIERAFATIESKTDYKFNYNQPDLDVNALINVSGQGISVADVLLEISEQTGLKFKQVNKTINVDKKGVKGIAFIGENQDKTITGKVISVDDPTGLPGVNVIVQGTSQGTVTDVEGNYSLEVPDNSVLVFSSVGYVTEVVAIENQTVIDMTLIPDITALDEIVVVGYGVRKKINLTGAVESVSSETFENRGAATVTQTLQGRVPNLNINYDNGGIDETPDINIRGYTSLNGGGPLILIDGVPTDATILSQMNPQDIESISVLKDAAASAIYGGRAAFGVVLVTTKSGKNQKLNITAEYNHRISKPTQFPEFVDTYTHTITVNEALTRHGNSPRFKQDYIDKVKAYHDDPTNNPVDEIVNPVYDADGKLIGGDYYYYGTVDYMNEVFKPSSTQQQVNLSLSGGTKKSSLFTSLGYIKDEGTYRVGNEDRSIFTMRANTSTQVNDWLKFDVRANYIKHIYDKPYAYTTGAWFWRTYYQRTYFPIRNRGNGYFMNQPIAYLESGARDRFEDDDITLTAGTEIKLLEGLVLKAAVSYRNNTGLNKENKYELTLSDNFGYRYPVDALWGGFARDSHIYHRTRQEKSVITDIYAQYDKNFGNKHKLSILGGFNQQDFNSLRYYSQRRDIISESVPALNLTLGEDFIGQSEYHWAIRGAFYRVNYSYDNRYLFEFNGRYDGTSRFKQSDRFGFFPSASAAWRISGESFMQNTSSWLDDLRLRASYGSLGNQYLDTNDRNRDNYAYIPTMEAYRVNYILGDEKPVAIGAPGLVDPALTWETVTTLNFGLDILMLDNRLGFNFDIYNRITSDMLVSGDALPGILGTNPPTRNSADLETKGWELTASWRDDIGEVGYGLRFNVSDSRSYISKFDNPTGALSRYRVGQEVGEIWGYETEGFFQNEDEAAEAQSGGSHDQSFISGRTWKPGDIKYKDLNGDNKIDEGDQTLDNPGDLKIIGNSRPRYNFGITANASWKGFTLEAFFLGVGQRHFVPSGSIFWPYYSAWDNLQTHQLNETWTPENPNAYFPQMEAYAYRNYEAQTKYLQNAAYVRLKNLSLIYAFPQSITEKLHLSGLLLSFNGHNLWESHSLRAPFDPEGGNGLEAPFRRSYSLGLKVNF